MTEAVAALQNSQTVHVKFSLDRLRAATASVTIYKYTLNPQKNQAFLKRFYDNFTKGLDFLQESVYNKTYRMDDALCVAVCFLRLTSGRKELVL